MKIIPVRFYFQRAKIFGWLMLLSIIGYVLVKWLEATFR